MEMNVTGTNLSFNATSISNATTFEACDDDEAKRWTEMIKIVADSFVAPVIVLIGFCGNFASFVIFGNIASKIRHMIKADEPSENGTLITILFLRALALLDTLGLLLTPVPEACMLLYNFMHSWNLHRLYYSPVDSVFPRILVWTIPSGLVAQAMTFWTLVLLAALRVSLRTSGRPSCCTRSTRRAGFFILITCLICLASHAPSFQWYKAVRLNVPCSNREAVTVISETDTSIELWIGKVMSYALADCVPFLVLLILCFCLAITFCISRKEKEESELVLQWDSRLHGAVFFICLLSCCTLGLTTLVAIYEVGNGFHDWFESDDLAFTINWWAVLIAEILLVLLQSIKFIIYLIFLRPFRQLCLCKSDEVINEIGRTQYELNRYSMSSDNTKL